MARLVARFYGPPGRRAGLARTAQGSSTKATRLVIQARMSTTLQGAWLVALALGWRLCSPWWSTCWRTTKAGREPPAWRLKVLPVG
jgi:hypothetical protein